MGGHLLSETVSLFFKISFLSVLILLTLESCLLFLVLLSLLIVIGPLLLLVRVREMQLDSKLLTMYSKIMLS